VVHEHNEIIRESAARWNGVEVKTEGDSFMVVFSRASDAIQFAVDSQQALEHHFWPAEVGQVRVRIGIHTGEALASRHPSGAVDYFGPTVNRAARVEHAGHGGQILVSEA